MNSKIFDDELTCSATQMNKQTAPSNVNPFSSVSPISFRHSTTPLLEANKIVSKQKAPENQRVDSILEQYKSDSYQSPNLQPIKVIGNGAFGYVFEAYCKNRQCKVALKRTQKAGNIISREFEILDMLRGKQNVVQLLDFFYSIDIQQRIIQNTVLEFCDMNLEDVMKNLDVTKDFIPMATIKKYSREIFNGLKNMHEIGIAHRDLKPENILLKDQEVRICDVGSSKILDMSRSHMNTPYVVSRYYRAPELILACNKYDFSIDIWAVGCIIFELITKTPMFPGDAEGLQIVEMQQILGCPSDSEIQYYEENLIEQGVSDLFKRTCKLEKNQKLNLHDMFKSSPAYLKHDIYSDEDLKDAAELVELCLKWIPEQRISADQALKSSKFLAQK